MIFLTSEIFFQRWKIMFLQESFHFFYLLALTKMSLICQLEIKDYLERLILLENIVKSHHIALDKNYEIRFLREQYIYGSSFDPC